MGAFCSCFHVTDTHDNSASDNTSSDDCVCFGCCIQRFMIKRENIFGRQETHTLTLGDEPEASSEMVVNHSSDQSSSHGGAQTSNAGPMDTREQQNEVMRRQEKGTSCSPVEEEPISQSHSQVHEISLGMEKILKIESLNHNTKIIKILKFGAESGIEHTFSQDEEDACPTCLVEYTEENPKIVAKCSHHYHLSCIYEWAERSPTCPVCGKLMEFDESF